MNFDNVQEHAKRIYTDLIELVKTPGPTGSCARVLTDQTREAEQKEFPMTKMVRKIVERFEASERIEIIEDNGNVVLVGGLKSKDPNEDEIRNIPIVLGAHVDEVTYLVSDKSKGDFKVLIPLCSPPTRVFSPTFHPFKHQEAQILGLRNGELRTIGYGNFHAMSKIKFRKKGITMEGWEYLLEVKKEVQKVSPGDVAIQDYIDSKKYSGIDSVIVAKALDDRVGVVATLYAFGFLSQTMPIKAILSGDEEGVPHDVSWARLILPTYRRFCKNDVFTILCDGINGADLAKDPSKKNDFLTEALLVPYTSNGKGGGDYRLFSLVREKVIPLCKKNNFEIRITTDYVSRSFDPKIMNEYPLITFIDWSNGLPGELSFRCHFHEEVVLKQILNIIGSIFWTSRYLYENRKHINL